MIDTQTEAKSPNPTDAALLHVYDGISANFLHLQDTRFKLLSVLPAATVAGLAAILSQSDNPPVIRAVLCATGAFITLGLFIYDKRNSSLIKAMVSRGARIERTLRIEQGQFTELTAPAKTGLGFDASHDTALNVMYGACALAWMAGAVITVVLSSGLRW